MGRRNRRNDRSPGWSGCGRLGNRGEPVGQKWLRGVWTSGATAGWVVGGGGTTLALLNGTAWQAVPTGGVSVNLLDVWGSKVDDVWAVGEAGTILHWRGTMWTLVPNGGDGGMSNALRGVWGSGPKDIWAVGTGGAILHYNGAAWLQVAGGETYSLNDVWGAALRPTCGRWEPAAPSSTGMEPRGSRATAEPMRRSTACGAREPTQCGRSERAERSAARRAVRRASGTWPPPAVSRP